MASINCSRGNGHISIYWDNPSVCRVIEKLNVFPTIQIYDDIVQYHHHGSNPCPYIKNIAKFNEFCENNEKEYIDIFLQQLFE